MLDAVALVLAGLGAGILSGLLGVGGGILMTPVLHYGLGLPWANAVAWSLFAIAIQSPLGLWAHHKKGAVDVRMGAWMAAGALLGVAAGDWLLPRTPVPWLKLAFAGLMAFAAWRMVAKPPTPRTDHTPIALLAPLGLVAGLAGRLFGIGGGLVTVPVLALTGTPTHRAVGTSLIVVFVTAAVATGANLARGDVALLSGLLLAAGALLGVRGGVALAHRLPEQRLRRVFAAGLAVAAVLVGATSW